MAKWKCGICNKEFDNFQAQGFNGVIYCPLCYFKKLYKSEKSKNNKAVEYIENDDNFWVALGEDCGKPNNDLDKLLNILNGRSDE